MQDLEKITDTIETLYKKVEKFGSPVDHDKVNAVKALYVSNIITRAEARKMLELPDVDQDEITIDSSRFRDLKPARNRYDYLSRKLRDGKFFSRTDEKDYEVLQKLFSDKSSEIQQDSETIQQDSDSETLENTDFQKRSDI